MAKAPQDLQAMWDDMAKAVAQADTAWSRIENAMASLLEKLIGSYNDTIALHIYFAPSNTETRFKIVDAAAQVKMTDKKVPDDLFAEWNIVFNAVGRAKEVRNRIAHGEIQTPGQKRKGELVFQARLTASSFDISRRLKEPRPPQWPGLSTNQVRATADRFYWLAVRLEEIGRYWQGYSLRWKQPPLPETFACIVERRRNSGPLTADLTSPKPKRQPPASRPKPKGPKLSAKQRRLAALARRTQAT